MNVGVGLGSDTLVFTCFEVGICESEIVVPFECCRKRQRLLIWERGR